MKDVPHSPAVTNQEGNHEVSTIRRRVRKSQRRRDGLLKFAKDVTSQSGEDGVIARIFALLPPPPDHRPYFCVDVGAWDGKHLSNTYSLLVPQSGNSKSEPTWRGILIEADENKYADLCALHEPLGNVCVNLAVSCLQDSSQNLVTILSNVPNGDCGMNLAQGLDFLCIDIDGSDYWVLHGLLASAKFRPRVICIEFNPTMPDDLVYIPPRNDVMRYGASISALVELAENHGYTLVETTLYNAFFVDDALYQVHLKEEVPDTSIEALYEPSMATSLYQLYDGTIKLWGCKRMLWHRMPIDENKIQMLPREKRQFPFAPSVKDSFDYDRVVNLSPFFSSSTVGREKAARALLDSLRADGFVYVRGLPITGSLAQTALESSHAFLQSADEGVRRSCLTKDRARRGYSAMCTENFASLIGEAGPNDLVRKFRVGPENEDVSSSLWQPNIWPSLDDWEYAESFKENVMRYFADMSDAARTVVRAICEGLLIDDPTLAASLEPFLCAEELGHSSILTLLGYKTGTRHRGKNKGPLVAPHTDVGVITILLFDSGDCAVLQRRDESSGEWVDVDLPKQVPDDPVFVVNIADCFSDITGKRLPSTLHRVKAGQGDTPRNCCALFVGLDPSQGIVIQGESQTYEEWRKRRIARAQDVLKRNTTM